jgi:hypothetical protein
VIFKKYFENSGFIAATLYQKNKQIFVLKVDKTACLTRQILGIFALKGRREVAKLLIMKLTVICLCINNQFLQSDKLINC